jgi:histone-lysine N-methyltransferase SETD1
MRRRADEFAVPHRSGSARTEGYYKMDPREKMRTKYHFHRPGVDAFNMAKLGSKDKVSAPKAAQASREARSQQRRMLTALGDDFNDSELLKFNQLKFRSVLTVACRVLTSLVSRRKAMKFGKSAIHDWGLFAMENIGADEMVIEYVGDVVRPVLSDVREKGYEKQVGLLADRLRHCNPPCRESGPPTSSESTWTTWWMPRSAVTLPGLSTTAAR